MNGTVEVAIVGAGPYGLSLAAHLRAAGVRYRQFGIPLSLWRTAMPHGMYLKSQGFASNLSDPGGTHTLAAFCRQEGLHYADYGVPVSLQTFISYGRWFQQHHAPDVEELLVDDLRAEGGEYELTLSDGERVRARKVVVASGVEHFSRVPEAVSGLPAHVSSHSSAHVDLGVFSGHEVIVLGAGQSALETAALLNEAGASVRLVARRPKVSWNGLPLDPNRPLLRRLREPEAGLGSGWSTWFYSCQPSLYRRLPVSTRVRLARTAMGPAGAWWLRRRVEGQVPLLLNHAVRWAEPDVDGVRMGLEGPGGRAVELRADHVISATGYRPDLTRLPFLSAQLRGRLRMLDDTPDVDADFQSSVAGLYFVGPAVTPTFGPVMRFVYGADYAVRAVTASLVPGSSRRAGAVEGARR